MVVRNWGEGRVGDYCLTGIAFHSEKILKVLEMGSSDGCTTV